MKKLIPFLLLILLFIQAGAQKKLFVRVYDNSGKRINNGFVVGTTDSSLRLLKNKDTIDLPISGFSFIKTKRSAGNNLLVGSMIGAAAFGFIGIASANPDDFLGYTAAEGFSAGILFGAPAGAAIGGLSALLKNPRTFSVNGDKENWREFQTFAEKVIQNKRFPKFPYLFNLKFHVNIQSLSLIRLNIHFTI